LAEKLDSSTNTSVNVTEVRSIPPECRFRLMACKLAEDFLSSTRALVASIAVNPKETPVALERLRRNYLDIDSVVEQYYGHEVSFATTRLLKEQTELKHSFLAAIKSGDAKRAEKIKKQLYANTDNVAASLAVATSPHLSEVQIMKHLRRFVDLSGLLLQFRLEGRWSEEVNTYDRLHEQCLGVVDMISGGMIKQFPDKFQNNTFNEYL
jgi:hypothetical protein